MLSNRARATAILDSKGLSGVIGSTPENVGYIAGFWAPTTWRHRTRKAWAILPRDPTASPCLILSVTIADVVVQQGLEGVDLYFYGDFYYDGTPTDEVAEKLLSIVDHSPRFPNAEEALKQALIASGMGEGRFAIDEWGFPVSSRTWLAQNLPNAIHEDGYDLLRAIRMIKTPEEVERIRAVIRITESAFEASLREVREGRTELELAQAFCVSAVSQGALPTLTVIGGGRHGAFPTAMPGQYRLRRHDLIRYDIGCFFDRYHSDMARTVVVTEPTPEGAAMYEAVRQGLDSALAIVRPGVTAAQVFEAALAGVEANGVAPYQRHHCGHGQGVEGYEPPMISRHDHTVLEPGMVLCVETPYYRLNVGGVQIEDIIVVTEDGYEALTTLPRHLIRAGDGA